MLISYMISIYHCRVVLTLHFEFYQICDSILDHAQERLPFTSHLVGATTVSAYPMLNKDKLRTELSFIYESPDFSGCCSALALYQVLQSHKIQETFSETLGLLNILKTSPMTTAEAQRCFSTLTTVKTLLRNTMAQQHLNTLAMLSVERTLIRNMPDFNERVIDHFARRERGGREKFPYK